MIIVNVRRGSQGIDYFRVSGHANFEDVGLDIVCAGVSAVVYGALGALQELCGLSSYEDVQKDDEDYISFELPSDIPADIYEKACIILETMLIGLKQIRMAYNEAFSGYVSIIEEV